ncbi:MAG: NAD(P)H-hydrate dehydratase [Janthinobacterium lividum]
MQRITSRSTVDLFDIAATRSIEQHAVAALPPNTLMQRAGLSVARLAMAKWPHARTIWIACGPGNNGGDGLEAAAQLRIRGFDSIVTLAGDEGRLPPDAAASLERARRAGVTFAADPPARWDLAIDALLGIGASRALQGAIAHWLQRMHSGAAPVLAVDVPSGLDADTGRMAHEPSTSDGTPSHTPRTCLSLLTLKPGLFTADGRDATGELWFDDLGCTGAHEDAATPVARLAGAPAHTERTHASHKGSYGDVAVIGGAPGMSGAAWMSASAALHAGAGRVFLGLLDRSSSEAVGGQPELMHRSPTSFDLAKMTVVCGCGGGDAVSEVLPRVLSESSRLVLDADALNAVARDPKLQDLLRARSGPTVITPHPLEAARLLGVDTASVQADRLKAAHDLAARYGVVVVLKGSGSMVAESDKRTSINMSGNGRLATAGTGDVLSGMVGAALASGDSAFEAARDAVWRHGDLADRWPADVPLTAGALARGSVPA